MGFRAVVTKREVSSNVGGLAVVETMLLMSEVMKYFSEVAAQAYRMEKGGGSMIFFWRIGIQMILSRK